VVVHRCNPVAVSDREDRSSSISKFELGLIHIYEVWYSPSEVLHEFVWRLDQAVKKYDCFLFLQWAEGCYSARIEGLMNKTTMLSKTGAACMN
jgi:hypothetical protein